MQSHASGAEPILTLGEAQQRVARVGRAGAAAATTHVSTRPPPPGSLAPLGYALKFPVKGHP